MGHFSRKLGLTSPSSDLARLVQMLLDTMEATRADFTQTFRQLSRIDLTAAPIPDDLWAVKALAVHPTFVDFRSLYRQLAAEAGLSETDDNGQNKSAVQYVLRNWMAEWAIRAAEKDDGGDWIPTRTLLRILRRPYDVDPEAEALGFSGPPPAWSCSLRVSCSS